MIDEYPLSRLRAMCVKQLKRASEFDKSTTRSVAGVVDLSGMQHTVVQMRNPKTGRKNKLSSWIRSRRHCNITIG